MSRRSLISSAALAATAAAALSACVVVPVDPRTGQPYPLNAPPAQVNVIAPPPPPVPPPLVMTARLYPLNEQATRAGMLTATVVDQQTGRAAFTVGYRGDTLQGEASRVEAGYVGFGGVHQAVLGAGQQPRSAGQRGIANGFGPRGVSTQCEYVLSAPARGTGVCQFSDGAHYQMHFGG